MTSRTPQLQAKRDRNDLLTGIAVGAIVVGILVNDSIQRLLDLFAVPGSITVTTRVPAQEITAAVGGGVPATAEMVTLTASGVNVISVASLVIAIVLRALCLISVAVFAVIVCLRLLRGIVFDRVNTGLTFTISILLLLAGLGPHFFETMGLNGVFAALGGDFSDGRWLLFRDGIPLYIASVAAGVLVIFFRRGAALQREIEGLV
ncbi:hypothetical protein [Microbacterium sp. A93]|uniref:hypothetical protein n=1 Tax=Microbacterium sp. A93 TaxID=3450716 RepID=UPI003F43978A